ncbi:MAG: hypothetical protein ACOYNZ_00165 [Rhodoferax sp.]
MNKYSTVFWSLLAFALSALTACGGGNASTPAPLSDQNINLIFVLSPDLTYAADGDVNPVTSNLSNQGLQRSLLMASYLKQQVLGGKNVTGIYAVAPMTHLQTVNNWPDLASMGAIQQFAMLNQISLPKPDNTTLGNSFPLNVSYAAGMVLPTGVAAPYAGLLPCPSCQGLDFSNSGGRNDALVDGILKTKASGFHVFSAPWETASAMLVNINKRYDSSLTMPSGYAGPNLVYAVSIAPSGNARLVTFDANLTPTRAPVVLPANLPKALCNVQQHPFGFSITAGQPFSQTMNGVTTTGAVNAVLPKGISTNQTVYMIRHAEAHPSSAFDDGNYIAAGQWRALGLADALRGKISPDIVMSIDPAQVAGAPGNPNMFSYVRTDMTVEPYAIANNLPFYLVSSFSLMDVDSSNLPDSLLTSQSVINATNYLFIGGSYANRKILLAWEHDHLPPTLNDLLSRYFPKGGAPVLSNTFWPSNDYDTVWTVKLDAQGNLTADNALCEGIDSATLQKLFPTAPQF